MGGQESAAVHNHLLPRTSCAHAAAFTGKTTSAAASRCPSLPGQPPTRLLAPLPPSSTL